MLGIMSGVCLGVIGHQRSEKVLPAIERLELGHLQMVMSVVISSGPALPRVCGSMRPRPSAGGLPLFYLKNSQGSLIQIHVVKFYGFVVTDLNIERVLKITNGFCSFDDILVLVGLVALRVPVALKVYQGILSLQTHP
jgi:hypothetical protein